MRTALVWGSVALAAVAVTAGFVVNSVHEKTQSDLIARAAISEGQAREKALQAVPGGRIVESEIEDEDGRLIWSFDLVVPGSHDLAEVEIDANTGEILAPDVEDADDEDDDRDDDNRGDEPARHALR